MENYFKKSVEIYTPQGLKKFDNEDNFKRFIRESAENFINELDLFVKNSQNGFHLRYKVIETKIINTTYLKKDFPTLIRAKLKDKFSIVFDGREIDLNVDFDLYSLFFKIDKKCSSDNKSNFFLKTVETDNIDTHCLSENDTTLLRVRENNNFYVYSNQKLIKLNTNKRLYNYFFSLKPKPSIFGSIFGIHNEHFDQLLFVDVEPGYAIDLKNVKKNSPLLVRYQGRDKFTVFINNKIIGLDLEPSLVDANSTLKTLKINHGIVFPYNPLYENLYNILCKHIEPNVLGPFDKEFLSTVKNYSAEYENIEWWLNIFADLRKKQMIDGIYDPTFFPNGSYFIWNKFMFELSRVLNLSHLDMMYGTRNKYDPASINVLTALPNCTYFEKIEWNNKRLKVNEYVYDNTKKQFFYIRGYKELVVLKINEIVKENFIREFKKLVNNVGIVSGLDFEKLLQSFQGSYPYIDSRYFFISHDNNILHNLNGELKRIFYLRNELKLIRKRKPSYTLDYFSTVDVYKKTRAFSLRELWRMRRQIGDVQLKIGNITYDSAWDIFEKFIFPELNGNGILIPHLIVSLAPILEIYFTAFQKNKINPDLTLFRETLEYWIMHYFHSSSIQNMNFLYGQQLIYNGKPIYLINIFLDCLEMYQNDLTAKLMCVTEWLCLYNASFICNEFLIKDISKIIQCENPYEKLSVSSFFDLNSLTLSLKQVNTYGSIELDEQIDTLIIRLPKHHSMNSLIIYTMMLIYKQRAHELKNAIDPKQIIALTSKSWVRLAQLLATTTSLYTSYDLLLNPSMPILSVDILSKQRLSLGKLYYEVLDKTYENFSWFESPAIFSELNEVEIPRQVLPNLLYFTKLFYNFLQKTCNYVDLKKNFEYFTQMLYECSPDEVRRFYSEKIKFFDDKIIYVADILIDCHVALLNEQEFISKWVDNDQFVEKINALVYWLAQYDASFIINNDKLTPIYERLGVGPAFEATHLIDILQLILQEKKLELSENIQNQFNEIINHLQEKNNINREVIEEIEKIVPSIGCFFGNSKLKNSSVVKLIQLLCGAGYLKSHDLQLSDPSVLREYYHVFEPQLLSIENSIHKVPLAHYPLDHYLLHLEEGGKQAILLDNSVKQFNETGVFCNVDFGKPCNFLEEELEQIREKVNPKFRPYPSFASYVGNQKSITIFTYLMIKNFIDVAFWGYGTKSNEEYTKKQLDDIENATKKFYGLYYSLSEVERTHLNSQHIYWVREFQYKRVDQILIHRSKCIAVVSFALAHLCKNYVDYIPFHPKTEQLLLERNPNGFEKKFFADRPLVITRAKLLYVELMVQDFNFFGKQQQKIVKFSCFNNVPSIVKSMLDALEKIIFSEYDVDVHKIYIEMILNELIPAFKDISLNFNEGLSRTNLKLEEILNAAEPAVKKILNKAESEFKDILLHSKREIFRRNNEKLEWLEFIIDRSTFNNLKRLYTINEEILCLTNLKLEWLNSINDDPIFNNLKRLYNINEEILCRANSVKCLGSIIDSTIFNNLKPLYTINEILIPLLTIKNNNLNNQSIPDDFMDQLISLSSNSIVEEKFLLEVNIKFRKILLKLNNQNEALIASILYTDENEKKMEPDNFYWLCATYLVTRFQSLGLQANSKQPGLYRNTTISLNKKMKEEICAAKSLSEVIELLKSMVKAISKKNANGIDMYLDELVSNKATSSSNHDYNIKSPI